MGGVRYSSLDQALFGDGSPPAIHTVQGVAGALRAVRVEHDDPAGWVPPLLDEAL